MRCPWRNAAARALLLASGTAFASPASASDVDLFSSETVSASATFRLATTDGERSWVDGDFGKLGTSGGADGLRVSPELGEINLVWQPRLSWSLSATVVGTFQGGDRAEAGISQAFLKFKPLQGGASRVAVRAGLMWPPVSLEHEGADWHVRDTITPSAINSWIGEEVRPLALEGSASTNLGAHELTGTLGLFAANDTAGTLLAFRGWALHDRKTLAFNRQPLPHLEESIEYYQAPYTHPLLDVGPGFAERPGYYAKLAWQLPVPVKVELFHYDNHADPEAANADLEWGWRTRFDNAGLTADLGGGTNLRAQAMQGRTRMGPVENGDEWLDARFRSAFALLSHDFSKVGVAARAEAFDVRQNGSIVGEESEESGWALTLAAKREFGPFLGLVEAIHVFVEREGPEELELDPKRSQTRLEADLRLRW